MNKELRLTEDELRAIIEHSIQKAKDEIFSEVSKLTEISLTATTANAAENSTKENLTSNLNLESLVTEYIRICGIPAHIKGYEYLRSAIILCVKNPSLINMITKGLYPTVAEIYKTTPSRVERAIRHAIATSRGRANIEHLSKIFGNTIDPKRKATSSEFIATIVDQIRLFHPEVL